MQKIQFFLLFTACCLLPTSSIAQSWNEVQKIVASDRDTSDQFGRFVSISGNYAIVGAYSEDEDAAGGSPMSDAGSAYMFERDGGGNWNQVQKIVASDRAVGDQFGLSVSISGNYAIVGAWQEDPGGISNAGSAYVFERDGGGNWNEVQKIEASDRAVDDWFGSSVSISDTYAIVGAFFEDHNAAGGSFMDAAGSAYVFERDGGGSWNQVQKIVASDRFAGDFFGNSISISGNYAIVAAALADGFFGSAYVFERDGGGNWNQVQKIFASDRAWNDVFGGTVSISGNYAIVGAYLEDEDPAGGSTLDRAGSAYVFERNGGGTWNQVQKIVASDRAVDDRFGVSVSISDSHAIVGAYWEDHDAAGGSWMDFAGSAYVFERDVSGNWNQVQKIVASDRAADDWFGRSVSISGSYAIVGAYQEDHDVAGGSPMSLAGSAYLFEWGAPVLTPAFLADTVCLGDSTSFTDQTTGSPTSWLWNFDDLASGAANTSTLQNPRHLFSSSGSYDVKLVASDGSSTDSITQTVIVKPIPTADAGLNVFLCAGDSATLNATGGSIYSWTPSAGLSDTSTSNPVAQPAVTTLYTVTVTDTNGCVDSDTVRVTVAATIIADAGPDTSICFGDSIQLLASGGNNYAWTPPSTGISDTSIADPFASPGSTITYHVTVTSGSCSETDSVMITVHSLPTANAGIDDTICLGDSVTIGGSPTATGTGGYEFSWTPAATLNDSTLANPIATPTVTTTYIVIVTDTNGCQNTLSIIITVLDSVIATVTADTAICQGDSIQLTASGGATYSWFPATGLNNNSIANPIAMPDTTTQYMVVVEVENCQPDTAYVTIIVTPYPIVNLGNDTTICLGDSVILDAVNPGATYNWSTGTVTQTITVSTAGNYSVQVTDSNCTSSDNITINVDNCTENTFFIPNSFSPNDDGNNDVLWIRGQSIKTIRLSIYNRWGEKVFKLSTVNYQLSTNKGWDGIYKGKKLNTAVFTWYAEVEFEDGDIIYRKGNMTLIR